MESPSVVLDAFKRAHEIIERSFKDLTAEELWAEPKPPIGWLLWHMTRVKDREISFLAGFGQLWIEGGWHARFGLPANPTDYGPAHTHKSEEINSFPRVKKELLLDYYAVVTSRANDYLGGLSSADFDRLLDEPRYKPLPSVSVRLVSVIADSLRHAGQIEYLVGWVRHRGWYPGPPR
jgi:hypothetical protein